MKRILIWGLLLFSTPALAQQKEYPSFTRFIDSVFRAVNVKVVDININKGKGKRDTLFAAGGYWARRSLGVVKYYTWIDKRLPKYVDYPDFLGIYNKRFEDTIRGYYHYRYTPHGEIRYGGTGFIAMEAEPTINCNGSSCTYYRYPVIAITNQDTVLQVFEHNFSITGLHYADINHDGHLDFIDIHCGLSDDDINKVIAKDNGVKRELLESSNEIVYKITLYTFRKHKWEQLKDRNGNIYCVIIALAEPLQADGPFKILLANWPG
ncbi:hypothetical protein [Chitinophaga eiseniae]|uniref:Uncharacterized protein n=1 Tax=Chitinophaga eiseniae TaxID=634771 RepID=A0A847S2C7_9BACT|nr:hypothetical protein [Chitinophaga eiseniae]NLR77460.1 hypothetical protein [Chitinophaga eiseniae]